MKSRDVNLEQVRSRPLWIWILAMLAPVVAVTLPFIPGITWKFWGTNYLLFLGAMLVVPPILLWRKGRRVRVVFMLVSLALFGFLQMACTRAPGNVELIIIGLLHDKPFLMHAIKFGVLVATVALFARYYCSFICPQGVIQELLYRPPLKIKVPPRIDRILKYGKYLMLGALILSPLLWDYRLFRAIGPFKVLFNLDGGTALTAFLAVVLLASVFIGRPFCRYLCPIGGLLALLSRISLLKLRVDATACNSCRKCALVCRAQTDAITVERGKPAVISTAECILCKECEEACPQGAIYYGARPRPVAVVHDPVPDSENA